MTNFGKIGSEGEEILDPYWDIPAPSAVFPKGSHIEYLFQGLIWIGATVEDANNPGLLDTLVSVADDSWWTGIYELNPPEYGPVSIWQQANVGDDEILAEYCDTTTYGVPPDPNDERPHRPLGLKIHQHSYCWSTPGYDEFFIIEYAVENIYNRDLHDAWFGIVYDGDVWDDREDAYYGYTDDLCGFKNHAGRVIGWLADNDGDPDNATFTDGSPTGVMGLMLVNSTTPNLQTNFNWWISNINSAYDWGPRLTANYDGLFPGGGQGTPGGDRAKYKDMSGPERDYDLAYSALDWTAQGWMPNSLDDPSDFASGTDAKFLLSYGPFELAAGQVETLTFAYFAGYDFHTDPANYANNLQYHTDDSVSIARYYDNLNFSDFLSKADTAIHYYNIGFDKIPIGPPSDFHAQSWSREQVVLSWYPREHPRLAEYRIYKGTQPGIYDSQIITPNNFIDTLFTDDNIDDNTIYYYVIKSANDQFIEGCASPEISINSGKPQIPLGLVALAGNNQVELTWQPDNEYDIAGYLIYRSTDDENDSAFSVIDTSTVADYMDHTAINGIFYKYRIRTFDNFGYLSDFSDTVYAIPHEADFGLLLINANTENSIINPDCDSMAVFYNQLLLSSPKQFTVIDSYPQELQTLANYRTIVWCNELMRFNLNLYHIRYMFERYLDAGGNLIIAGIQIIDSLPDRLNYYFKGNFEHDYLNLEAIDCPDWGSDEFIGGSAYSPGYPDFIVDPLKANRIIIPFDENNGRLFGIGTLLPRDTSEVIYNFRAVNPDTSDYHGRPIALIHHDKNFNTATLNFPLYYVEPGLASVIFNKALQDLENNNVPQSPPPPLPDRTSILKNYPNPFNLSTSIEYELDEPSEITINIYDILGRKIAGLNPGPQEAGVFSINWKAIGLPSGVYFAKIANRGHTDALKMVLLK